MYKYSPANNHILQAKYPRKCPDIHWASRHVGLGWLARDPRVAPLWSCPVPRSQQKKQPAWAPQRKGAPFQTKNRVIHFSAFERNHHIFALWILMSVAKQHQRLKEPAPHSEGIYAWTYAKHQTLRAKTQWTFYLISEIRTTQKKGTTCYIILMLDFPAAHVNSTIFDFLQARGLWLG